MLAWHPSQCRKVSAVSSNGWPESNMPSVVTWSGTVARPPRNAYSVRERGGRSFAEPRYSVGRLKRNRRDDL
jgi:hypothetical protein